MVTEFGMSALGPISYEGHQSTMWLAREMGEGPSYSDNIAFQIDTEVKKIIDESYNLALDILSKKTNELNNLANLLLEKETVFEDEFKSLLGITKEQVSIPDESTEEVTNN